MHYIVASQTDEAGRTDAKELRGCQHGPTNQASNPVVQLRSGDTTLALGERGEYREPSVTQGIPTEGFGGEGFMQPFQQSRFEPQHPCRHALAFRCIVHCDNEFTA